MNNSQHRERLKGLKGLKQKNIYWILDDEIFYLLIQNTAEIELINALRRKDWIFGLITSLEEASNKNENNKVSLISNSSCTSNDNADEIMCKLAKLVIKKFDSSMLN